MSDISLEISSILSHLLKESRISEAELARKINVPRATINRLVSGRTPDPRASTLNAIASYFEISIEQLIGNQPIPTNSIQMLTDLKTSKMPIIPWKDCRNWENILSDISINGYDNWISVDASIDHGEFAVILSGEAMSPQFEDKTILIISPNQVVKNRDFVVAYLKKSDELVFRQILIDDKTKFLKAVNEIFPLIKMGEKDKIIGVVIQTRKNYD